MKNLKIGLVGLLLGVFLNTPSAALSSSEIISSALNYSCVSWQVDGICIWLTCKGPICWTSTSMKVSHFNPETVVSSYGLTGGNPWAEVASYSQPHSGADGMGHMITPNKKRDNLPRFKNVDVIGHPGSIGDMGFGYLCNRTTTSFMPYLISTLDYYAWRWGVTEQLYLATHTPGLREMAPYYTGNNWGNIFPRQGYIVQPDDYKAGAVMAQRAADITSNTAQPHIYVSTQGSASPGYWPPGPIRESDMMNHRWQGLHPVVETACYVFPTGVSGSAESQGAYAWALWRPYSCCEKAGQKLIYYSPSPYH